MYQCFNQQLYRANVAVSQISKRHAAILDALHEAVCGRKEAGFYSSFTQVFFLVRDKTVFSRILALQAAASGLARGTRRGVEAGREPDTHMAPQSFGSTSLAPTRYLPDLSATSALRPASLECQRVFKHSRMKDPDRTMQL